MRQRTLTLAPRVRSLARLPRCAHISPHPCSPCSVFILDYSSEVEVTNCTNCQIFIGARRGRGARLAGVLGGWLLPSATLVDHLSHRPC